MENEDIHQHNTRNAKIRHIAIYWNLLSQIFAKTQRNRSLERIKYDIKKIQSLVTLDKCIYIFLIFFLAVM